MYELNSIITLFVNTCIVFSLFKTHAPLFEELLHSLYMYTLFKNNSYYMYSMLELFNTCFRLQNNKTLWDRVFAVRFELLLRCLLSKLAREWRFRIH